MSALPPLRRSGWLALLVATIASGVVYAPLVDNYFMGDDFLNLYRIVNGGFWEYILTPHGGHTLVARNFVFYLCAHSFGTNPAGYFWVVLATHVVNVALLFSIVWRLTQSMRLAFLGATLWGTSPVHDGALGWYSVYGHVMAATMMLLILALLTASGEADRAPSRRALRLCYALALLGTVSFGIGIGVAMVLPLVVAILTPAARASARWTIPLVSLLLVVPLLYVGLFWINGMFFGEGLETPQLLVKYTVQLWDTLVPNTVHLIAYGALRLLTSFRFDPSWATPTASHGVFAAIAVSSIAAVWRAPGQLRRAIVTSILLIAACYGFIAVGRSVFFQAYTSALMAIQPRYHYAGLVPLTLLVCLVLARIGAVPLFPPVVKTTALVIVFALIAAAFASSSFRIDHHDEARKQVDEVLSAVSVAVANAQPGDSVYIPNRSFAGFFAVPPPQFPGWAAVFAIYHRSNQIDGRAVYFVDKREPVLVASARGRRTSGLIVPPPSKGG